MLTPFVQNLYNQAEKDLIFQEDLKKVEYKMYKPELTWRDTAMSVYAGVYLGYLLAKGKYKKSDFK